MKPGRRLRRTKHRVVLPAVCREHLGQHFRRHAGGLGHHHGGVGRHIAMGGIARRFRRHPGNIKAGRQFTCCHHGRKFVPDERLKVSKKVHFIILSY